MLRIVFLTITLITVFVDAAIGQSRNANNIDKLPSIIWEITFGDETSVYSNEYISILTKTNELIVGGYSETHTNGKTNNNGIWIWKVSESGAKTCDVDIKNITIGRITYELNNIQSMIVNDDETIVLVVNTTKSSSLLLKINFNGDILLSKNIGETKSIYKIISLSNNCLLLIGEDNGYPAFIKIDETGNNLWSKGSDRSKYGNFIDGIATKDGGFLLVENTGASSKTNTDITDIFIIKYNASGEKQNEIHLSGKYGNIGIGQNNNVAILYDKSRTYAQDVWLQVYDSDFVPSWNTSIASSVLNIGNYKMSIFQNSSYMIAGNEVRTFKPLVTYVDQSGKIVWSYLSQSPEKGSNTDLVCSSLSCYVVYSVYTLLTKDDIITKIKVIRFHPQATAAKVE